jgi:hypothetical protein
MNPIQDAFHTSGRFSIFLAGIFADNVMPDNDEKGNNNLFSAMVLSRDGGAIYAGSFVSGSTIDHNWLHDTQAIVPGAADTYWVAGVYLDYSTGYSVFQNVLWNDEYGSIFVHGAGSSTPSDNMVRNRVTAPAGENAGGSLFSVVVNVAFVPKLTGEQDAPASPAG